MTCDNGPPAVSSGPQAGFVLPEGGLGLLLPDDGVGLLVTGGPGDGSATDAPDVATPLSAGPTSREPAPAADAAAGGAAEDSEPPPASGSGCALVRDVADCTGQRGVVNEATRGAPKASTRTPSSTHSTAVCLWPVVRPDQSATSATLNRRISLAAERLTT